MFNSLDEGIRETGGGRHTPTEMLVRFAGIAVISLIVFGGLYLLIVAFE
jgi:hypothetical protein